MTLRANWQQISEIRSGPPKVGNNLVNHPHRSAELTAEALSLPHQGGGNFFFYFNIFTLSPRGRG
jgi:hypothetical protein